MVLRSMSVQGIILQAGGVADTGLRESGSALAMCVACCCLAGGGRVTELKLLSLRDEARASWQR